MAAMTFAMGGLAYWMPTFLFRCREGAINAYDVKDFSRLASKFKNVGPQDTVSIYIVENLSSAMRQQLNDYKDGCPGFAAALAKELDGLLRSHTMKQRSLYDTARFAHVQLREETEKLLARKPKGDDLLQLNRLLLEDAYPEDIVKRLSRGTIGLYFGALTVLAGLLGTFVGGWVGDWYQKRHPGSYFLVCGVSMILGAPFAMMALGSETPSLYWFSIFLSEFFLFLNTGPGNTIIANVIAPNMRATAFAVNTFAIHLLGDAVSPAIIGSISDLFASRGTDTAHSLGYSMYIMPIMMVVSGVIFFLGAPHLGRDTANARGSMMSNKS
jgi:hypothetical protein